MAENSKIIHQAVRRQSYLDRIAPFMRQSLIKVLTGQRRVGKSYILLQLIDQIKESEPSANIIYINCEDLQFASLKSAVELNDYVLEHSNQGGRNYIFVDEIQEIDGFERAVRSLLLNPLNDIYITGSNAKMLSGELATVLSGRYVEIPIYSLSYSEFLEFHRLEDSDTSFELYCRYGGLPYLIHLEMSDNVVFEYLNSVYSTIVFRDIVARYGVRNVSFLERIVRFLADNVGSIFSAKRISDYLKSQNTAISTSQVLIYADYLASVFLVDKVRRYDVVGKRIFEIGDKYYFENVGIRNAVAGYRIDDNAKILENVVYNHLLYCGYKVMVGTMSGGLEIDFVAQRGNEKIYVQVALRLDHQSTIEREFNSLLKIEDNYPKMVVTADPLPSINTYQGVIHQNVRQFLTTTKPLL